MTGAGQVSQMPADASGEMLSFVGLYRVFVGPNELFEKLKNSPRVLVPYVVMGVVLVAYAFGVSDLLVRVQLEALQEQGTQLPSGFSTDSLKYTGIATVVVFGLLTPLVASWLALFIGNFIMAGKSTFKQLLSVMLYGEIIYVTGLLVHLPMILFKNTLLVTLSLAAVVPNPDPTSPVWVGLSKIGFFNIWEIIVVGIGLSVVFGFSRNKGYTLAVLSIGLLSILHVITTAVGSAFG